MFKSQSDVILKEKNAAFKVLIATKKKLEATCQKASKFINTNKNEIQKKENEIQAKKDMNSSLEGQIAHMQASIAETDRIINPVIEEAVDGGQGSAEESNNESSDGQDSQAS